MGRKKEETSIVRHRKVCTEVEINLFVDLSVSNVSRTVRRLINQSWEMQESKDSKRDLYIFVRIRRNRWSILTIVVMNGDDPSLAELLRQIKTEEIE